MKTRICNNCGWAHFGVSSAYIDVECEKFGAFITTQTEEVQGMYGYGPQAYWAQRGNPPKYWDPEAYKQSYKRCFRCGGSCEDFHDETEADHIPMGVTMQPIQAD